MASMNVRKFPGGLLFVMNTLARGRNQTLRDLVIGLCQAEADRCRDEYNRTLQDLRVVEIDPAPVERRIKRAKK